MQTIIQNHGTLKVTKSKILVYYKTISGSDIYSNFLFLVAITRCDTASSINGVGKATVFKKHLEEAALVFTANRKLHEEIELAEKKQCLLSSRAKSTFPQLPTSQTTYFESNYDKIPPTKSALKKHSFRIYFQITK